MDATDADAAMLELAGHLALRRSLLAWTMRWCARGDAELGAMWSRTTDAKAMLNVLVAVSAVRSVAVKATGAEAELRIVLTRADGSVLDESVTPEALPGVIRRAFAVPTLAALIDAVRPQLRP
ncbi:MAG: hypothetical protein WCJ30_00875 [Deltaproteobacteria bacterium]